MAELQHLRILTWRDRFPHRHRPAQRSSCQGMSAAVEAGADVDAGGGVVARAVAVAPAAGSHSDCRVS